MFVAVSVASADGVRYDSPVDTFLRAQGGHPAIPTVSGCAYLAVCDYMIMGGSMHLLVGHFSW